MRDLLGLDLKLRRWSNHRVLETHGEDRYLPRYIWAIGQSGENDVCGGLDIRLAPFAEVRMLPFNGY